MFARKIVYWLGLVVIMLLACSFQTVFWFQVFGHLSPPLLWLSVTNYVILSRKAPQSLFWVYFLVTLASIFSSTSLGLLLLVIFVYYWAVVMFKNNFYMESTSYFVLINFGGSFLFHFLFLMSSHIIEPNPTKFLFMDRLTQILLTPLFSIPIYFFLKKWERVANSPEIYMDTARYESE
jgi:hypothetical protein